MLEILRSQSVVTGATYLNGQYVVNTHNGYGASIIEEGDGTYELAVLNPDGGVDYSTPITYDVLRWRSEDEIISLIYEIANL